MSFAHIPLAPPTSAQGGPDLPVPPNGSLLPKATDLPTRLDHWWHTEHWTAMLRLRYISLIFLLLPFTLLSSGGMPAGYGALSAATLDSLLSLSSLFLAFLMLIMSMFVECDAKKALACSIILI